MNPGTSNNIERTGTRDMDFSAVMRQPRGVRVCDLDPAPICPRCERFILLWEVKRIFPDLLWAVKHCRYVINTAGDLGVPAYFVYHQPEGSRFTVIKLADGFPTQTLAREHFIQWVEEQQRLHQCRK